MEKKRRNCKLCGKNLTQNHEYVVVYKKQNGFLLHNILGEKRKREFKHKDKKGYYRGIGLVGPSQQTKERRPNLDYGILYDEENDKIIGFVDRSSKKEIFDDRHSKKIKEIWLVGKATWLIGKEGIKKLDWWFKNGDRDATFFAVPYDNGEEKPFYVDFIVKLKDERIGLFDTKSGLTKKVAGPKIDGLYKYIQNENKKGKKLFGGVVANTDQNYRGRWVYFNKPSKDFKDNSFANLADLIL